MHSLPRSVLLAGLAALAFGLQTSAQVVQRAWVARADQASDWQSFVAGMGLDSNGNVYVAGTLYTPTNPIGTATILKYSGDGNALWNRTPPANVATAFQVDGTNLFISATVRVPGQYSIATMKYDVAGSQLWAVGYESEGSARMAVDAAGNVYVAGATRELGGGSSDVVTIKYGPNGEQLWTARYEGRIGGNGDSPQAVAVDGAGNVLVAAISDAPDGGVAYTTVKYTPDGRQLWVAQQRPSGTSVAYAYALAVDRFGNFYVTGSAGTVKCDPDGQLLWSSGKTTPSIGVALRVDQDGHVYVTGDGTAKYDADGRVLWTSSSVYGGRALTLDDAGNVYITASIAFPVRDWFTVKYDSNGNQLWEARYDGPQQGGGAAQFLAVDQQGNVYVTGQWFSGPETSPVVEFVTVKYTQNAVAGRPAILSPPRGQSARTGTNVTLTVTASGTSPLHYRWRYNGAILLGASSSSLTLTNVQSINSGAYSVIVSNSPLAWTASPDALLIVGDPPALVTQPEPQRAELGEGARFSVNATGTPAPNYQWRLNGTNLTAANGSALIIPFVSSNSIGDYSVVVTNVFGAITSAPASLTVVRLIDWPWEQRRAPTPGEALNGVTYGNGRFVAIGTAGTNALILSSPDGMNWMRSPTIPSIALQDVVWGGDRFVAVGDRVLVSTNGVNWTIVDNPLPPLSSVVYGNGIFVASGDYSVASGGYVIRVSTNGVDWGAGIPAERMQIRGLGYGDGQFIAVGSKPFTGFDRIWNSLDGVLWIGVVGGGGGWDSPLVTVAWGGGKFVAIGFEIFISDDGLIWNQSTFLGSYLQAVTYGDGMFLVVGAPRFGLLSTRPSVLSSPNGEDWNRWNTGLTNSLRDVVYGNGTFVALGESGAIVQSGDRRPRLTASAKMGAGAIELSITGGIVRDYRLQAAGTVPSASWVELLRFTNAELITRFTDTAITNLNRRFYRLVSP